jgi:hypothetical protein
MQIGTACRGVGNMPGHQRERAAFVARSELERTVPIMD